MCRQFCALLADFSKAFDCLEHELPTRKPTRCGFNLPAFHLVHHYLSKGKSGICVNIGSTGLP